MLCNSFERIIILDKTNCEEEFCMCTDRRSRPLKTVETDECWVNTLSILLTPINHRVKSWIITNTHFMSVHFLLFLIRKMRIWQMSPHYLLLIHSHNILVKIIGKMKSNEIFQYMYVVLVQRNIWHYYFLEECCIKLA